MGRYLNPGNAGFQSIRRDLYIDKSGLISYINQTIGTPNKLTCVSRPRRFGKSFTAKMLCAYYDKSCGSEEIFSDLIIAADSSFKKYLNQYNVIYLDLTWFISVVDDVRDTVIYMQKEVVKELSEKFPNATKEQVSLPIALLDICEYASQKFMIIIDEWDVIFREAKEMEDYDAQQKAAYIPNEEVRQEFLRGIKASRHKEIAKMIQASDQLLQDTINMNCRKVESAI